MEFRILGPLDVAGEAGTIRLGGRKQRAVLTILLLRANQVVPVEQIADDLYGDAVPATAVAQVRDHVSQLRKLFGRDSGAVGDASILETHSPGYLLRVGPDELDAIRFQRASGEAADALEAGDARAAAALLGGALALWRGPPLADFFYEPFAQSAIARLEALRLRALERRIEADLLLGQDGQLVAELEELVREHPLREQLRAHLMLALYRSGRQAEALGVYHETRRILSEELGIEASPALRELAGMLLRQEPSLQPPPPVALPLQEAAKSPHDARNPYKGLRAFGEADAVDFFGRESMTRLLAERLEGERFVAVVGPSGSGKSSLVLAGLVPALRQGALPGSETWSIVEMTPGEHPLEELEAALLRVAVNPPVSLLEQLESDERGLCRAVKRVLPAGDRELVLVVDQLEELFTLVADEDRRAHVLTLIERAVKDPRSRLRVIVTLRADFYDRPLRYRGFAELLGDRVVSLRPLAPDELERAIAAPAASVGAVLEQGLLAEIVADVLDEPGALPLLQYALTELFDHREADILTRSAYRALGGVSGALAGRAEEIYDGLRHSAQDAARQLFLRLVMLGEGTEDTRRRVDRGELGSIKLDQTAMAQAIDAFGTSRLLSFDRDPRTGISTIEIAHEALLREWARLRQWIDAAREDVRMHRRLLTAAREWADSHRDPSFLLRGSHLAQFEFWSEESGLALTELEREFVAASSAEGRRELIREQRQNRRLKTLLAGVGVLLVLAVIAGVFALLQRQSAKHEATVALARQLGSEAVIEPRIDRAMLLAREAVNLNHSTATEGTLLATLLRSPAAIATFPFPIQARPIALALSPDGTTLAVSDSQNEVRLFDTRTRREARSPLQNLGANGQPVLYSEDGSLFAAIRPPGLALLDTHTLKLRRFLRFDPRFTYMSTPLDPFGIAPDNTKAFLAYAVLNPDLSDGPAYLDRWNVATGQRAAIPLGSSGMIGAGFVSAGKRIVTITDTQITTWDAQSLRRLHTIRQPIQFEPVVYAGVSPDGRTVAVGTLRGSVSFIDVATGRVTPGAGAHSATVEQLVFSPDGHLMVSTGDDAKIIVWDPGTGQPIEALTGHGDRITGAAFSHDGQTLFTASPDGAIFEWDLGAQRRFGQPFTTMPTRPQLLQETEPLGLPGQDAQAAPPPLAISPDGTEFAARAGASSVALYSTRTLDQLHRFPVQAGGDVIGLAWSSSGQLAVTGDSGHVQLWDVNGRPRLIRELRGLHSINKYPEAVTTAAFSPDGRLVAVGDINHTSDLTPYRFGSIAVWDARSGKLLWKVTTKHGWISALTFSPDGQTIAAAREDGVALLDDARTGRLERTLHLEGRGLGGLETAAFAPDGVLATGTWAGIVQLWNPATGSQIGHPTLVATAPVASISFAPTGDTFATTGASDGLAKLWTTKTQQQFGATFPGDPGQSGNARFTPDGSKLIVVYQDGKGFIWPVTLNAWKNHACAVAGRNFTHEEWSRFVGGGSYSNVCAGLPDD
jgi:WD40 repeat protein/DNA-binding SARP family transcriptional activator